MSWVMMLSMSFFNGFTKVTEHKVDIIFLSILVLLGGDILLVGWVVAAFGFLPKTGLHYPAEGGIQL